MDDTRLAVILNIYEVPDANRYIKIFTSNLGIFHSGVQILNQEYSYGGHPHDYSGIFVTPPKDTRSLSIHDVFKYKESKLIGYTELTDEEIDKIVDQMGGQEFRGKDYHLVHRNCNHFSNDFCFRLCGTGIPEWVNKVVEIMARFPAIVNMIPKEFITPTALQRKVTEKETIDVQNDVKNCEQNNDILDNN